MMKTTARACMPSDEAARVEAFNEAVRAGARIVTQPLGGWRYIHIAYTRGAAICGPVRNAKGRRNGVTKDPDESDAHD